MNYETITDDDGSKIEVPKETIEYIEINYWMWFLQTGLWIIVCVVVRISLVFLRNQCDFMQSKAILYFIEMSFVEYLQEFAEDCLSWFKQIILLYHFI